MDISIKTIPHAAQRYETVGDWFFDDAGNLKIRVSDVGNPRYEFLVAYHELTEAMLCKERGISEEEVTEFDKQFERERAEGKHGDGDEPGDDPRAPYCHEHFIATRMERFMCNQLDVDWGAYEKAIEAL